MLATIARPKDACPSPAHPATHPSPTGTARTRPPVGLLLPIAIALAAALAALLLGALSPAPVLGGTSLDPRCDGASLRNKPTTTSHRQARLPNDARVVATKIVKGSKWATKCGGERRSSRKWYRIVSVDGVAVSKLYGRKAVFGAKGVFSVVSIPLETACGGVRLRTDARTSAKSKVKLPVGARVVASGTVSGGKWSADCDGAVSGKSWYRITRIGSRSVSSLFGVKALYAARGLWERQGIEIPPPPDTSGYIEGIDISHWQGTIDWAQVAGAGKRFAFMKASDGILATDGTQYIDPTYVTNRAQANANGIRIGAYHFARPGPEAGDAVAEADHFIATAAWASGDLLPVLDLETAGGLGKAKLQAWVKAFLDRIHDRTGVKAMIYTSPKFWQNKMGDTQSFAAAGYRSLWIAHWTTLSSPSIPAANWGGSGWTFWQYTSDGSVAGIKGRVDLDRYRYASFDRVSVP